MVQLDQQLILLDGHKQYCDQEVNHGQDQWFWLIDKYQMKSIQYAYVSVDDDIWLVVLHTCNRC